LTLCDLDSIASATVIQSLTTAKLRPIVPKSERSTNFSSKVLPVSCIVVIVKLLPSPAPIISGGSGAPRVEKQVPEMEYVKHKMKRRYLKMPLSILN
jgi:hypothetical protein